MVVESPGSSGGNANSSAGSTLVVSRAPTPIPTTNAVPEGAGVSGPANWRSPVHTTQLTCRSTVGWAAEEAAMGAAMEAAEVGPGPSVVYPAAPPAWLGATTAADAPSGIGNPQPVEIRPLEIRRRPGP